MCYCGSNKENAIEHPLTFNPGEGVGKVGRGNGEGGRGPVGLGGGRGMGTPDFLFIRTSFSDNKKLLLCILIFF